MPDHHASAEQSALLVLVPAAEQAVGKHRARLDASARDGVPAHLTVLYPFLPPGQIGDGELAALAGLFAGFPSFDVILDRVNWFGEQVVWLGPRDEAPFRALTDLVFAAYPACAPYGGLHADVVPHLTIGHDADPAVLRAAAEEVRPHLPISARATGVTLIAGPTPGNPETPPGQWRNIAAFPLAEPTSTLYDW
jgi:2'-5' RNA ligase